VADMAVLLSSRLRLTAPQTSRLETARALTFTTEIRSPLLYRASGLVLRPKGDIGSANNDGSNASNSGHYESLRLHPREPQSPLLYALPPGQWHHSFRTSPGPIISSRDDAADECERETADNRWRDVHFAAPRLNDHPGSHPYSNRW
jgi:hypothetical protein